MKVLLDTHTWLWMLTSPGELSEHVRDLVAHDDTEPLVSAASAWEIAMKYHLGRLPLPEPPASFVPSRVAASGCTGLDIGHAHVLQAGALPPHHRDPFDRLLIAQAQLLELPLVSKDRVLEQYEVKLVWN